ncbi:MAG: hypothetical protein IJ715_05230 [Bacilli bacterium]|nr:hypothetical protein [Bacilli bacterium]
MSGIQVPPNAFETGVYYNKLPFNFKEIKKGNKNISNIVFDNNLLYYWIPSTYQEVESVYVGNGAGIVLNNYIPKMFDIWNIDVLFEYNTETQVYYSDALLNCYTYWGQAFQFVDGTYKTLGERLTTSTKNTSSGDSTIPLHMFGGNNDYYVTNSNGRMYYFYIFDKAGKLKHNYRAVKRVEDSVLGLYDTVDGIFYTSVTNVPITE